MSAYLITYFISDTCGCGCGHDHNNNNNNNDSSDNNPHSHVHEEPSEERIVAKIKSLGSWGHVMPEAYIVKCSLSAEDILSEIKSVANSGDILFVTKLDADSTACQNEAVIKWIAEV